jgi:hypothetical protein
MALGVHTVGGLIHFILRLFIWRLFWRFGILIWHIRTFGPVILVLIVGALAVWIILRWRRRNRPGPPPGRSPGEEGPADAGPRDW